MRLASTLLLCAFALQPNAGCTKSDDSASADDPPKKTKKQDKPDPVKPAKVPERHRDKHDSCSKADSPAPTKLTFGPRMMEPPGPACASKADCKEEANGRCHLGHCTYDRCYEDSDCKGGGVCTCQQEGKHGYYCKAGNCAVDSDCGTNSYCSPTWSSTCGAFLGVTGWYCHRPDDECTNDSECRKEGQTGYCAYSDEKKHWICGYGHCVG